MTRFVLPIALGLSLAAPLAAGPSRYLVLMRAPLHQSHIRMINEVEEGEQHAVRAFRTIDAFAATLTDAEAEALRGSREVRAIEPLVERHINDGSIHTALPAPSDVAPVSHQVVPYGIDMIHARQVWTASRGEGVNIAIIDTGLDLTHPDLVGVYAGGYNTFAPDEPPVDDERHGTHVAGTIAAVDNQIGVVGVAPGVRVWSVKVLDKTGFGDNEHIAAGIDWVIAKKRADGGRWIISMSLGGKDDSFVEKEATARAVAEGILVIAAAGNRGVNNLDFPAAYNDVMPIGAIDSNKLIASFSNFAPTLSMVGPGVGVLSTVPTGTAVTADIRTAAGDVFSALPLRGTPRRDIAGPFVMCGFGSPEEFPPSVAGKIAVIRRGVITFNLKARNAKAAGASAMVVLNAKDGVDDVYKWTLILPECDQTGCHDSPADLSFDWPLSIGLSYDEGEKLLALLDTTAITASFRADDYERFQGTSMATPHVSGTAALLWSLNPNLRPDDIRNAIEETGQDLGAPGYDPQYGHGLVDALAAAQRVAPEKFGLPPIVTPPRRRGTGH